MAVARDGGGQAWWACRPPATHWVAKVGHGVKAPWVDMDWAGALAASNLGAFLKPWLARLLEDAIGVTKPNRPYPPRISQGRGRGENGLIVANRRSSGRLLRPDDLVVLDVSWRGMLAKDGVLRNGSSGEALLAVELPPQHLHERGLVPPGRTHGATPTRRGRPAGRRPHRAVAHGAGAMGRRGDEILTRAPRRSGDREAPARDLDARSGSTARNAAAGPDAEVVIPKVPDPGLRASLTAQDRHDIVHLTANRHLCDPGGGL